MENKTAIWHTVSILSAAFIAYKLLTYKQMPFEEQIPTAAGGTNNPGNIEKPSGRTKFRGEIVIDDAGRFTSFKSMAYGYRAIGKILKTKYSKGQTTLRQMIASYAPAEDGNNVSAYVNWVSTAAGIDADTDMATYDNAKWADVVQQIGVYEQGQTWLAQYGSNNSGWANSGWQMA